MKIRIQRRGDKYRLQKKVWWWWVNINAFGSVVRGCYVILTLDEARAAKTKLESVSSRKEEPWIMVE